MIDIEGEALRILESMAFDPANPPKPLHLAYTLVRIEFVPGLRTLARWVGARDLLQVRLGLSPPTEGFAVAHELAERHLRKLLVSDEHVEQYADALAAALIVPSPAVRWALRDLGRALPEIAETFGTTQSIVSLRIGEVTGTPTALITPRRIHVRGDDWAWPEEVRIRRIASGKEIGPLTRTPITDTRRRVVLAATP